tara:strand:+ start:2112 stop:2753 length:642 start_codon:yes stop_codon:yes gene_type:complete
MTHTFKLTAVLATLLALPTAASAQDRYPQDQYDYRYENQAYEDCKKSDTENQILGAIVGGSLGAVVGNEVGDDEGAVVGGLAGGTAGTAIANKDCEKLLDQYNRYDRSAVRGEIAYDDRYVRRDHNGPYYRDVNGQVYYNGVNGERYYRHDDGNFYDRRGSYKGRHHPSYYAPGQMKKRQERYDDFDDRYDDYDDRYDDYDDRYDDYDDRYDD